MLHEAHNLASLSPNVVVKCPTTSAGLVAVKTLAKEGINTNVTLVFSPNQALLAAKTGATYVSPFIGRLDDAGHEGMKVIEDTLQIYANYEVETHVLVASIRHSVHVVDATKLGAHAELRFIERSPSQDQSLPKMVVPVTNGLGFYTQLIIEGEF